MKKTVVALALALASPATAATITTTGTWTSADPGASGFGTNFLQWGAPQPSGLHYGGTEIGSLTHVNREITSGAIMNATLNLGILVDGSSVTSMPLSFTIDETWNEGCIPQCPDIVYLPDVNIVQGILVGGTSMILTLQGWFDHDTQVSELHTGEGQESFVTLRGSLTQVPEPAGILFLGFGLLGLARFVRKSSNA